MREPRFWSGEIDPKSREAAPFIRFLLSPLAALYAAITRRRIARTRPESVDATVICVGNLTAGGVGKSPIVQDVRDRFGASTSLRVASLSRGYKGKRKGPLQVAPEVHTAKDVGDEPIMLARTGESWIGADRAAAGRLMAEAGVDIIIMDDGHQNPSLRKDFSIVVVDAKTQFGNGFVIPKGPLREPVLEGLKRADLVILMGDGAAPEPVLKCSKPVLRAKLVAKTAPPDGPLVAFAGIGRPEKFFEGLSQSGADLRDTIPFPDHHFFTAADLSYLEALSKDHAARLVTTEKDFARLPQSWRAQVLTFPVIVQYDQPELLDRLLNDVIKNPNHDPDR